MLNGEQNVGIKMRKNIKKITLQLDDKWDELFQLFLETMHLG